LIIAVGLPLISGAESLSEALPGVLCENIRP
jgi:hypothetical protein